MEPTVVATTTAPTGIVPSGFGIDIFTPLTTLFTGNGAIGGFLSFLGIFELVSWLWSIYAVLAYLVAIVMLGLYIYASTRLQQLQNIEDQMYREAERLWDQKYRGAVKNTRLHDVVEHLASDRPNDWKLAIIEADIILDELLKQRGYAGASLGERLKSVSPSQLATLQDAWEAHKVRNRIAHEGADFVLTHRLAEETIQRYRRVLSEFGVQ